MLFFQPPPRGVVPIAVAIAVAARVALVALLILVAGATLGGP